MHASVDSTRTTRIAFNVGYNSQKTRELQRICGDGHWVVFVFLVCIYTVHAKNATIPGTNHKAFGDGTVALARHVHVSSVGSVTHGVLSKSVHHNLDEEESGKGAASHD